MIYIIIIVDGRLQKYCWVALEGEASLFPTLHIGSSAMPTASTSGGNFLALTAEVIVHKMHAQKRTNRGV